VSGICDLLKSAFAKSFFEKLNAKKMFLALKIVTNNPSRKSTTNECRSRFDYMICNVENLKSCSLPIFKDR